MEKFGTTLRCTKCVSPSVTMIKITTKTAADLILEAGIGGVDEKELPSYIQKMIGCEFVFQVKVTPFNFTPKHRSFTVSIINPETPAAESETGTDAPMCNAKTDESGTSNETPAAESEAGTDAPIGNAKTDESGTSKGTKVKTNRKRPRE